MKITRIEPVFLRLPYEHGGPKPPLGMGETRTTMDALLVRVETDQGLTGWGEAFGFATTPVTLPAIRDVIAPLAVGREADDIAALTTELKRRLQNMMRGGPARFALSALDIALWDLKGQAQGEPVWQMLGGQKREHIPAYASMLRLPTPELTAEVAANAAARGYRHIKLHQKTADTVAAARAALGPDIPMMVDVNCAFNIDAAIKTAREMAPYDLMWLEEPISPTDDYDALIRLRAEGGVPVALGENLGTPNDFGIVGRLGAADIVQPSVVKIGGISDAWKAINIARDAGLKVFPHSPFVGPGLVATVHLVAAMNDDTLCEHRFCDLGANPLGDAVVAHDGTLPLPQGPGLGISVDETVIAKFRVN